MDLFVLDFEAHFQRHLKQWVQKNRHRFDSVDQMEGQIESVYETWLRSPAAFLDGAAPATYFYQIDDPRLLVKWMLKYLNAGVWVPEPMMERITEMHEQAHEPLLDVLLDRIPLPPGEKGVQARILAIVLLSDAGCTQPMALYMDTILTDPRSEYVEHMVEALQKMGDAVREPMLERIPEASDGVALEWALTVLCDIPGDERIFQELMRAFSREDTSKAVMAGYLAKYADPRALPLLKEALTQWGLGYIDWIETRQAFEVLGGMEEFAEPDFSGDPEYESLKALD